MPSVSNTAMIFSNIINSFEAEYLPNSDMGLSPPDFLNSRSNFKKKMYSR